MSITIEELLNGEKIRFCKNLSEKNQMEIIKIFDLEDIDKAIQQKIITSPRLLNIVSIFQKKNASVIDFNKLNDEEKLIFYQKKNDCKFIFKTKQSDSFWEKFLDKFSYRYLDLIKNVSEQFILNYIKKRNVFPNLRKDQFSKKIVNYYISCMDEYNIDDMLSNKEFKNTLSEEQKKKIIKLSDNALNYFDFKTQKDFDFIVKQNISLIDKIPWKNRTTSLAKYIFAKDPSYLFAFDKKTIKKCKFNQEELERLCRKHLHIIKYIDNPSIKLQKFFVKKDIYLMQYIKNIDKKIQLYLLKNNINDLYLINNPCEEVQKYILESSFDVGNFHKITINEEVCVNCEETCVYKNFDGLYDKCPRFLEHVANVIL